MTPNLGVSTTVKTKLALTDIGRLSLEPGLGRISRLQV